MTFPTAITSQQTTDIQTIMYKGRVFVLRTPQEIVFQATVKDAVSGVTYASVEYDTPTTGAFGDIVSGMAVVIHRDASDVDNVLFAPTYARGAATASVVNIGWQSTNLLGTDTITVFNDYRINVRQTRPLGGQLLNDYAETFRKLPPKISGLQSVYAADSSSAASFSFAPTVVAMANGATITDYLWDVGDGTITTGTSTTQNITASFPAWSSGATDGWRWVSLTVTDSNSNTSTMHFQVFVGDFYQAPWVVRGNYALDIGMTIDEGGIGTIALNPTEAQNLIRDNHMTVVIVETKNGDSDPIVNNIAFVGRAKGFVDEDVASQIAGIYGIQIDRSHTRELHGYGVELATLPVGRYPLERDEGEGDWHFIDELNLPRVLWYGLRHLTTAQNVMSIDLGEVTYANYKNDFMQLQASLILESLNRLAVMVGARLLFSRDGGMRLTKDARLLSASDRNALDTVANLTSNDFYTRINHTKPPRERIGYIEATGYAFDADTSTLQPILVQVQAPKTPNTTGDSKRSVDYLLESGQTRDEAATEIAVLAANYLGLRNDSETIDMELRNAYWFLVADIAAWYTITYDFPSGVSYDTNTRWLLDSVSLSVNPRETDSGAIQQDWTVSASFTIETDDEGVALSIQFAPPIFPDDVPLVPTAYNGVDNPEDVYQPGTNIGSKLGNKGSNDGYPQPNPNNENQPPVSGFDSISVPIASSTATTMNKASADGLKMRVIIDGIGRYEVGTTSGTDLLVGASTVPASSDSGVDVTEGEEYTITATGDWSYGGISDTTPEGDAIFRDDATLPSANIGSLIGRIGIAGSWFRIGASETFTASTDGDLYLAINDRDGQYADNTGSINVNVASGVATLFTDGFYKFNFEGGIPTNVEALGSDGLQLNGGLISPIPSFSRSGYTINYTGTGNADEWLFVDGTDYSDNSGALSLRFEGSFEA